MPRPKLDKEYDALTDQPKDTLMSGRYVGIRYQFEGIFDVGGGTVNIEDVGEIKLSLGGDTKQEETAAYWDAVTSEWYAQPAQTLQGAAEDDPFLLTLYTWFSIPELPSAVEVGSDDLRLRFALDNSTFSDVLKQCDLRVSGIFAPNLPQRGILNVLAEDETVAGKFSAKQFEYDENNIVRLWTHDPSDVVDTVSIERDSSNVVETQTLDELNADAVVFNEANTTASRVEFDPLDVPGQSIRSQSMRATYKGEGTGTIRVTRMRLEDLSL